MKSQIIIDGGTQFTIQDKSANLIRTYVVATNDNEFIDKLLDVINISATKYARLHAGLDKFKMVEDTLDALKFSWDIVR